MISTRRSRPVEKYTLTSPLLQSVVSDVCNGYIKLPSFHGSWCWDENDVRKLIASIAEGHPIGSFTLTHAHDIEHRLLAGAENAAQNGEPIRLILDGQQRLTAAFQALCRPKPVRIDAASQSDHRLYLFDMKKSITEAPLLSDAIISVATSAIGSPVSTSEIRYADPKYQYEHGFYPTNLLFDSRAYTRGYHDFWFAETCSQSRMRAFQNLDDFHDLVIARFKMYRLPIITMGRLVSAGEQLRIFEKLNAKMR